MDSADIPMHTDDSSIQMNGDLSKKDTETIVSFDPRPQRVLRLNRRGFFLSSQVNHDDIASSVKKLTINLKNNQQKVCFKDSNPVQSAANGGQKIIKLNSSTKYSTAESVNKLKRTSSESDSNTVSKNTQEMPPKKKHKEITWP